MEKVVTLEQWLARGRQRSAVVQVLRKPMTAAEICRAAQAINPRLRLRDLWHLLPELQGKRLVARLTPRRARDRVYSLTDLGRQTVQSAFGVSMAGPACTLDWRKYAWVARAKIRRLTLDGLARFSDRMGEAPTASQVRKFLRRDYPVGLNPIIRALKELKSKGLASSSVADEVSRWKTYRLTKVGRNLLAQLRS